MTAKCYPSAHRSRSELSRRAFFGSLEAAALTCGCVEVGTREPPASFRSGSQTQVSVYKAMLAQEALIADPTRCSLSVDLGWLAQPGDQVRVMRSADEFAIYTIDALHDSPSASLRMSLAGRQRLGTSQTFAAILDTQVTATDCTDAEAQADSEFVERVSGEIGNDSLIVIAPHGGGIEAHTDTQASSLATIRGVGYWACKGWRSGGGAYDRWHVTSTDLSPSNLPGLAQITGVGYRRAVAFHGKSSPGVLIGGAAALEERIVVGEAVALALSGTGLPIVVAEANDPLNGDSPHNVVNWLTASGVDGIQLEQCSTVRSNYAMAVVWAVNAALDTLESS
ncbi:poly-gamma-glutamate hydrolase family protein [Pseudenhygromyxa sp. WMMC2535]|uniref:poly-gamma-glutamate hydrolase family protein n=1 Tax=Pseudenhygromyxa sp. WMMC2535 TaxID=2712867 RepID=UPI001552AFD9|nr:poly-gamma-glutamate hydrolase family protein [Pseudenhygromyxa sp. WMMC2535]NVB40762.1 poly-gamma-glutamate hydrolase family protein [Pseudenhygromyxa sp. WMMC2535]